MMMTPFTDRFLGWQDMPARSVVVDGPSLAANIAEMQRLAGSAELRPHIKTHKSLTIARMQKAAGATGFTCALPAEALMLLEAGLGPVTLARPEMAPDVLARLMPHALKGQLRFVVDCAAHVAALQAAAAGQQAAAIEVAIKVDVGLHRMGIAPKPEVLQALADQITAPLRLVGILSHAGHGYGAQNLQHLRQIAAEEVALMQSLAQVASPALSISIGATPTLMAGQDVTRVAEIRPGNYVFLDLTAVALGIASRNEVALAVVAEVIGLYPDRVVINVGSKVLSSDRGAHGSASVAGFGEVWAAGALAPMILERLSEEHGVASVAAAQGVQLGQKVLVVPNHSCPVVNLGGGFTVLPDTAGFQSLSVCSSDLMRS